MDPHSPEHSRLLAGNLGAPRHHRRRRQLGDDTSSVASASSRRPDAAPSDCRGWQRAESTHLQHASRGAVLTEDEEEEGAMTDDETLYNTAVVTLDDSSDSSVEVIDSAATTNTGDGDGSFVTAKTRQTLVSQTPSMNRTAMSAQLLFSGRRRSALPREVNARPVLAGDSDEEEGHNRPRGSRVSFEEDELENDLPPLNFTSGRDQSRKPPSRRSILGRNEVLLLPSDGDDDSDFEDLGGQSGKVRRWMAASPPVAAAKNLSQYRAATFEASEEEEDDFDATSPSEAATSKRMAGSVRTLTMIDLSSDEDDSSGDDSSSGGTSKAALRRGRPDRPSMGVGHDLSEEEERERALSEELPEELPDLSSLTVTEDASDATSKRLLDAASLRGSEESDEVAEQDKSVQVSLQSDGETSVSQTRVESREDGDTSNRQSFSRSTEEFGSPISISRGDRRRSSGSNDAGSSPVTACEEFVSPLRAVSKRQSDLVSPNVVSHKTRTSKIASPDVDSPRPAPRGRRRYSSSDDEDGDAKLAEYFQRLRRQREEVKAQEEARADEEVEKPLEDFIVDDDESISEGDQDESNLLDASAKEDGSCEEDDDDEPSESDDDDGSEEEDESRLLDASAKEDDEDESGDDGESASSDDGTTPRRTKPVGMNVYNFTDDEEEDELPDLPSPSPPPRKRKETAAFPNRTPAAPRPKPRAPFTPIGPNTERKAARNQLSFLQSLSLYQVDETCHPLAAKYITRFHAHKVDLASKLFRLFNEEVFFGSLDPDMAITWNGRLLTTAGFCRNKRIGTGESMKRWSEIELASKVLDSADRLRDTLVHEMCHAATWVLNGVQSGHGPLWKDWARRCTRRFPDLPVIGRCHSYVIRTKYTYKCEECGYCVNRHSKSLDTARFRCGRCGGGFRLMLNRVAGAGSATPGRRMLQTPVAAAAAEKDAGAATPMRTPNRFAAFVKENYRHVRTPGTRHADAMKELSRKFALAKLEEGNDDKENS